MQTWLIGMASKYALTAIIAAIATAIVLWYSKNKIFIGEKSLTLEEWIERKSGLDIPDSWRLGVLAWVECTFGDSRSTRQLLRKIYSFIKDVNKQATLEAEITALVEKWGDKWANHLEGASADLKSLANETKEDMAVKVIAARVPDEPENTIRKSIQIAAPAAMADKTSSPVTTNKLSVLFEEAKKNPAILNRPKDMQDEIEKLRNKKE